MSFQSSAACWARLYYRQPQDPLLVPLFTLIREGKLAASWPLEQDELLERLQKSCDMPSLAAEYNALFVGEECRVAPYRSAWVEGATEADVRTFLSAHGVPTGEGAADHYQAPCCWPLRGWKITRRKMKATFWKPFSLSIFCRGAASSWAKLKPMQPRRSGAPWPR